MNSSPMEIGVLQLLAWLGTYAVHSTVLIGSVWIATALLRRRLSHRTADVLWKTALVGGVFTATAQLSLETDPVLGRFDIGPHASTIVSPMAPAEAASGAERRVVIHDRRGHITITTVAPAVAASRAGVGVAQPEPMGPWPIALSGLFGLGALLGLGRLGLTMRRLNRHLRARRDVVEDPLLETFLQLCQNVGLARRVRLTASPTLRSPVALWRREICVPDRAIVDLERDAQRSMLAHELAHVVRGDPAWLLVSAAVEAVFFIQPLNRLARRRMQETAEFLADDWAVQHTGGRVALAKCLAEVATWFDDGEVASLASPMAVGRSPMRARIQRLLGRDTRGRGHPSRRVALTLGSLAAVVWLAPSFSVAAAPTQPPQIVRAPESAPGPCCSHRGSWTWSVRRWSIGGADADLDFDFDVNVDVGVDHDPSLRADPKVLDLEALLEATRRSQERASDAATRALRETQERARGAVRRAGTLRERLRRRLERQRRIEQRSEQSGRCDDRPTIVGV